MNLNSTLFAQFVVFFIFVGFIMKFVWPPLIKTLDDRTKKITDSLTAAEKSKIDLANAKKQVEIELKTIYKENQKRILQAEERAQLIIEQAKKTAYEEATHILASARVNANQQLIKVREDLRHEIAILVIKATEQILKREINVKTHSDFLNQLQTDL